MRLRPLLACGIVVGVATAILTAMVARNLHADRVPAVVERAFGAPLTVAGRVTAGLWPVPHLIAHDVSIPDPADPGVPLVQAARLKVELRPLDLLIGRAAAGRLVFEDVDVRLRTDLLGSHGALRTILAQPLPDIVARRVRLSVRDPASGRGDRVVLDHLDFADRDRVLLQAAGIYHGQPLDLDLHGGTVASLLAGHAAWPVTLDLHGEGMSLTAKGTVGRQPQLYLSLAGDHLDRLGRMLRLPLPALGPYGATGTLAGAEHTFALTDLALGIGRTKINGSLSLTLGGTVPRLDGRLQSARLALADFGPALGALADAPITENRLGRLDATIGLAAATLATGGPELGHVQATLALKDGRLDISSAEATLGDGQVHAALHVDARHPAPQVDLTLRGTALPLATLAPAAGFAAGRVTGGFHLTWSGPTLMPGADLQGLVVARLSDARIRQAGLDGLAPRLGRALGGGTRDDASLAMSCGFAQFRLARGVARVGMLVADIAGQGLAGAGAIDLGHDKAELLINPQAQAQSEGLFRLDGPLDHLQVTMLPADTRAAVAGLTLGAVDPAALTLPPGPPCKPESPSAGGGQAAGALGQAIQELIGGAP